MNCPIQSKFKKLEGYEFWEKTLKKARYVVAPMVDQSELAWRMLSKKYGAELCYSPMFHASVFNRSIQYRKDALASCKEDRPLIIQFCANDPSVLVEAALTAQSHCDAIDLNLGCPQSIARKGYYGAFLDHNWELISNLVKICHERLSVPITCKIRIFSDIKKTVEYAKMLERAGCQLLTVHGRTKEMKGLFTGLASWDHIKAVKEAVNIPVFANGNIQYKSDVTRCFTETGVDGVMIAEGSLHNPALFTGETLVIWNISLDYLDFAEKYPCPLSFARGHVFKLCHHGLQRHVQARTMLSDANSLDGIRNAVKYLRDVCITECWQKDEDDLDKTLPFPHWICQPFVRSPSKKNAPPEGQSKTSKTELTKALSKKKMKKLLKRGVDLNTLEMLDPLEKTTKISHILTTKTPKITYKICIQCGNPGGFDCVFMRCKPCCKKRRLESNIACSFHSNPKRRKEHNLPEIHFDNANDKNHMKSI